MIIESFIPNKDQNWIVRKGILYYKKFALIPILNKIDGDIYINLDKRCIVACLKLIQHCIKNNFDFMLCDKFTITEKHIWNEHIDGILWNYLFNLDEKKFFQMVENSEFNFVGNLCKFIKQFDCNNRFICVYNDLNKGHFSRTYYDPYSNKIIYKVKTKAIRDYYETLFREVKISLFLSED